MVGLPHDLRTEDIYKIYVESFLGESHLKKIQQDAKKIVADAIT